MLVFWFFFPLEEGKGGELNFNHGCATSVH